MSRSIRPLCNFQPPATELEVHHEGMQFVRKLSGFNAPSRANEAAFEMAVQEVTASAQRLIARAGAAVPLHTSLFGFHGS